MGNIKNGNTRGSITVYKRRNDPFITPDSESDTHISNSGPGSGVKFCLAQFFVSFFFVSRKIALLIFVSAIYIINLFESLITRNPLNFWQFMENYFGGLSSSLVQNCTLVHESISGCMQKMFPPSNSGKNLIQPQKTAATTTVNILGNHSSVKAETQYHENQGKLVAVKPRSRAQSREPALSERSGSGITLERVINTKTALQISSTGSNIMKQSEVDMLGVSGSRLPEQLKEVEFWHEWDRLLSAVKPDHQPEDCNNEKSSKAIVLKASNPSVKFATCDEAWVAEFTALKQLVQLEEPWLVEKKHMSLNSILSLASITNVIQISSSETLMLRQLLPVQAFVQFQRYGYNEFKPQFKQITNENFIKLQEEFVESQRGFLTSMSDKETSLRIESLNALEEEAASRRNNKGQKAIMNSPAELRLHWDGLSIEDERDVLTTHPILSEPDQLNEFVEAYVLKFLERTEEYSLVDQYRHVTPTELLKYEPYKFQKYNTMMKYSNSYDEGIIHLKNGRIVKAVLSFEAAIQKDYYNTKIWKKLTQALIQLESHEAVYAARQILKLIPTDLWAFLHLAKIYQFHNCSYQACQMLLNWLKYNEQYCDIVPPNCRMKDKKSTKLENKTLRYVKRKFMMAAKRRPNMPDIDVQLALAILFDLSKDHDKVADCLRVALKLEPSFDYGNLWVDLGMALLLDNKPLAALDAFLEGSSAEGYITDICVKIGLTFMYLKNYWLAVSYFREALNLFRTKGNTNTKMECKILAKLSLCLDLLSQQKRERGNLDEEESMDEEADGNGDGEIMRFSRLLQH